MKEKLEALAAWWNAHGEPAIKRYATALFDDPLTHIVSAGLGILIFCIVRALT